MKKITYIFTLCAMMAWLSSCDKNSTPVFDEEYSALNIWFGTIVSSTLGSGDTVLDSVTYNYSYAIDEMSIMFNAQIVGTPVDYDRSFVLEAYDGDLSEAEGSYRTETYIFKAGQTKLECPIYFDTSKLKNRNSFTQSDGHLYFRVVANDDFVTGVDKRQKLVVVLKNYLAKPDEWDNDISPYSKYSTYFGSYSKTKYQFMIQVLGLIDFHIYNRATMPYNEETNEVSLNYAKFMAEQMKLALAEYNANHETPLMDETGALVTF
mgnify:CR=1 FL=1|jgi:hypothetical protein